MKCKKFLCTLLSIIMIVSLASPAFAASSNSVSQVRVIRSAVEKVHSGTKVMSEAEVIRASNLIAEKEKLATLSSVPTSSGVSTASAAARIATIEEEPVALGAVPLTVEDIYELHGLRYNAPNVPNDTNYVHFYGMTAHIGNYDVYSIVASSTGFSQSNTSVPFYKSGNIVIYDRASYVQSDFNEYIELAASVVGVVFEDVFDKLPILEYVGYAWNLATYFNPTAQQKFTIDYTCGQTYIFSYVAEEDSGYYDFTLAAERKQGNCTFKFEKYVAGDFIVPPGGHDAYNFEATSSHWADYSYAVELYQNLMRTASQVGDIRILVDGSVAGRITMPTYSDIWSIPGV